MPRHPNVTDTWPSRVVGAVGSITLLNVLSANEGIAHAENTSWVQVSKPRSKREPELGWGQTKCRVCQEGSATPSYPQGSHLRCHCWPGQRTPFSRTVSFVLKLRPSVNPAWFALLVNLHMQVSQRTWRISHCGECMLRCSPPVTALRDKASGEDAHEQPKPSWRIKLQISRQRWRQRWWVSRCYN